MLLETIDGHASIVEGLKKAIEDFIKGFEEDAIYEESDRIGGFKC